MCIAEQITWDVRSVSPRTIRLKALISTKAKKFVNESTT